ncbi:hypothetical protein P4H39_08645 [Paenibacillus lautus]|nr:hypothetical protein [Paenibacillus lautus]MEC0202692.1 hypothetical protein [Paenibacillus lautus]
MEVLPTTTKETASFSKTDPNATFMRMLEVSVNLKYLRNKQ